MDSLLLLLSPKQSPAALNGWTPGSLQSSYAPYAGSKERTGSMHVEQHPTCEG